MSQVMLTSNVLAQVCPGETIVLTCTTTGSSILRWTSNEYIGSSNQIEFLSAESVGTTESMQDAVANLTANHVTGGMRVLTSMLRITARSTIPNFSITCISGDLGRMNTSMFNVAGMYSNIFELDTHTTQIYVYFDSGVWGGGCSSTPLICSETCS